MKITMGGRYKEDIRNFLCKDLILEEELWLSHQSWKKLRYFSLVLSKDLTKGTLRDDFDSWIENAAHHGREGMVVQGVLVVAGEA